MKKMFYRSLSFLLVLCLCIGLTACGAQNAAGGLGTLSMDGGQNGSGGIGTLGDPTDSSEPSEPDEPAPQTPEPQTPEPQTPDPQTPAPTDGYAVFSCTAQDFSFLYNADYSAVWDDEAGATIYTDTYDSIPYVLVYCTHRGDTEGFDITNYFYFMTEDMKTEYGSRLLEISDTLTLTIGNKSVPGILYTYTMDEYTIDAFRLLDDTGDSLMVYTAKYLHGQGDSTLEALGKAISTLQLDADYYTNGGGTDTGTETPPPQQDPAPSVLSTEPYECKYFTVTIPTGWEVFYEVLGVGDAAKRLCTFVYDPADPNNMFFFVQAIEQFFVSESAKQAWMPYMPAYCGYSPVLSGDPTAEATLEVWGDAFALMSAEGTKSSTFFRNYELTNVRESKVLSSSASSGTTSYVLGSVTIPGAKEPSLMLFQNTLVLMDAPAGLPSSAKYYTSYSNMGIVLNESAAGSQFDTLFTCLNSFDPTGFADKYSSRSSTEGGRLAVPETDVSELYFIH